MEAAVIRTALFAGLWALGLAACGGSGELHTAPLDELMSDAIAGDPDAMAELERRADIETQSQTEAGASEDPEALFQTALFSGQADAVDELVASGNPYAQTHVAIMLSAAPNLSEADAMKARGMLEAAAVEQHAPAIFRMSEDHLSVGMLYPLDEAKAFALAVQAADLGLAEAMYMTGVRYQYGLLTAPQDDLLAKNWLEKAKSAGHPDAQRQLDELSNTSDE